MKAIHTGLMKQPIDLVENTDDGPKVLEDSVVVMPGDFYYMNDDGGNVAVSASEVGDGKLYDTSLV